MKSHSQSSRVSFGVLQTRLIEFIKDRIKNGDLTERGLARLIRISQPQIHNVLKGVRKLTPEVADRLAAKFEISVLDLLKSEEMYEALFSRGPAEVDKATSPFSDQPGGHVPPKRLFKADIPRKGAGPAVVQSLADEQRAS